MAKNGKRRKHYTTYVAIWLMTIVLSLALLVQTPAVQSFAARSVIARIENGLGAKISFERIQIKPFSTVVLTGVRIEDENPAIFRDLEPQPVVFRAGTLSASFTLRGLLSSNGIHLRKLEIDDALFALVIEGQRKNNLQRVFGLTPSGKGMGYFGDILSVRDVNIHQLRYRMTSYHDFSAITHGLRWDDIDATADIKGKNLKIAKGKIMGKVTEARLSDKCGYNILKLSGDVTGQRSNVSITDLHLIDPWSDVTLPSFSMDYETSRSFKYFVDKVSMTGDIAESHLDIRTLSFFAPSLPQIDEAVDIKAGAHFEGPVNALAVSNLAITEKNGIQLAADCELNRITTLADASLKLNLKSLETDTKSLESLLNSVTGKETISLKNYAPGKIFNLKGKIHGPANALSLALGLTSDAGAAETSLKITDLVNKDKAAEITGTISTDDLDVGAIAGIKPVHEVSLFSGLHARLGKSSATVTVDSLKVSRLNVMDYDYSGINAAGTFSNRSFDGKIVCQDPNMSFLFQGLVNLSNRTKNALYRFYFNLGYADLHAVNLDKRRISKANGELNANYMRITKGDIIGSVNVKDLTLESLSGRHKIGDIELNSHSNDNVHRITFQSSFANGTYQGSKPIANIVKDIQQVTLKREVPALYGSKPEKYSGDSYDFNFDFSDSRDLLSFILPGLYIADSTSVKLRISPEGTMTSDVNSSRIAFKDKFMKHLSIAMDNKEGSLNGKITSEELSLSSLKFKYNSLILFAEDNYVGMGFQYDNQTALENKGEILLSSELSRDDRDSLVVNGETMLSNIYYNGNAWKINPCTFSAGSRGVKIDKLLLESNDQSILANGGFSKTHSDTLEVNLSRIDMGIASALLGNSIDLKGFLSGHAMLTSPVKGQLGLLASLVCEDTQVSGEDLGTLKLGSSWDDEGKRLNLIARNELDGRSSLNMRGDYLMANKSVSADVTLDKFNLGYLKQPLHGVLSDLQGALDGNIHISGPLKGPEISSESLSLDNVMARIAFTDVPYWINGTMLIDENGATFRNVTLKDRYDGSGRLTGGIAFKNLKDFYTDLTLKATRLEVFNTESHTDDPIYGNVFANATAHVTGPFNALDINVDASTAKDGRVHIPLNMSGRATSTNLLTFKEKDSFVWIDPYEQMMARMQELEVKENDMNIRLSLNVDNNTEAFLEIDKAAGNILTSRGSGLINLELRPSKDVFNINGDYGINSGNFHFAALGITSKDFTIQDGSSIKFNGDIMDSDLDINALYTTKTSLANLIADTTSVTSRRSVECGIKISDKLKNPQLGFSINVPDIDPTTKSRVESALNTDDKVQKQFLALLLMNSFLPDDQSGIVNNSNILLSNVADIMASQLNTILEKLDIPLDLGLNYQNTEGGTDIFDVAISTQLFNNRVLVNGAIGNRQYERTATSDVVGDLDIEVKLDKAGAVRLTMFSHSADDYTNYLDNSQRNGMGVTYQKEFNTLREFIRSIFRKKSANEIEESSEKKYIQIGDDKDD